MIERVTNIFFFLGLGGENATEDLAWTPSTRAYVIESYDKNACNKVSIRWPTGIGRGIM